MAFAAGEGARPEPLALRGGGVPRSGGHAAVPLHRSRRRRPAPQIVNARPASQSNHDAPTTTALSVVPDGSIT
jgi:hypothetical protein